MLIPERLVERFLSYIDIKDDVSACWLWTAARDRKGYGKYSYPRKADTDKQVAAHRAAYVIASGETIVSTQYVCHECDNPPCCNPAHLYIGNARTNMRDRDQKGRQARGEEQGSSVLTREQVTEIRRLYLADTTLSQIRIGKMFGVRSNTIHNILKGTSWGDINILRPTNRGAPRTSSMSLDKKLLKAYEADESLSYTTLGHRHGLTFSQVHCAIQRARRALDSK